MKTIEILKIIICDMDDPEETIKSGDADHIYRDNAKTIIFAASHVENRLAAGVGKYFFGDNRDLFFEFDNLVLSSDYFSFSSKRKTFLYIVRKQKILKGSECADLERLLAKSIKYRNMFTHGTPIYSGSRCILHYFEGCKKEKEITDSFLSTVEEDLTKAVLATENIVQLIKQSNTYRDRDAHY